MKKTLQIIFLLSFLSNLSWAQNGGAAVDLGSTYVIVADNTDGELDIRDGNTIELWFKANDVNPDQKLYSKIKNDFSSGYILGIENGKIKFEIFNQAGEKTEIIAGSITPGNWTHVAVTINRFESVKLYLNGELVGEENFAASDFLFTEVELYIGTASWDPGALNFSGEIDEVRYWNEILSAETINDWMHKTINTNEPIEHPAKDLLRLYHTYDAIQGTTVTDHSNSGANSGSYGGFWVESSVPMLGQTLWATSADDIGGVWAGHPEYTAEFVTISGTNLTGEQSALVDASATNFGLDDYPIPAEFDGIVGTIFLMASQNNPTVNLSFDLSELDMTDIASVALLESSDLNDFTAAKVYEGTMSGSTLNIPDFEATEDQMFYFLGVKLVVSSVGDLQEAGVELNLSPNPSEGLVQFALSNASGEDLQWQLMDVSGKVILNKMIPGHLTDYQETLDLSHLPKGFYSVRLNGENGLTTKKLIIQ